MLNNKNFKVLTSTVLLIIFLLPIVILGLHSFEKHEHNICCSDNVEHFCNKDFDCSDLHVLKISEPYLANINYQFFQNEEKNSIDNLKHSFLKSHQQLSFSLRGPPFNNFI